MAGPDQTRIQRTTSISDGDPRQMHSAGLVERAAENDREYVKVLASVFSARFEQANAKAVLSELKKRSLLEYWMQGSTVGESHLLCNSRPSADIEACTFCQTKALTRAALLRVLQNFPEEIENITSMASGIVDPDAPDGLISHADLVNFDEAYSSQASIRRGAAGAAFRKMPGAVLLDLEMENIVFDADLDCVLEALAYELST